MSLKGKKTLNPFPHVPILGFSISAADKDMMSNIYIFWLSRKHCGKRRNCCIYTLPNTKTLPNIKTLPNTKMYQIPKLYKIPELYQIPKVYLTPKLCQKHQNFTKYLNITKYQGFYKYQNYQNFSLVQTETIYRQQIRFLNDFEIALGRVETLVGNATIFSFSHKIVRRLFLRVVNPFLHDDTFWRPWETSLLKTLWEKEKLLVMSNFSFSQCFLPVWITFCHFRQIWNCCLQTLLVWKSLKFVVW